MVAIGGGLLALAVAGLATASVAMRWLLGAPIEGDFEYVKMATAVAVFSYLPYTQARRGNIMVDTFSQWLSPRVRHVVDGIWDIAYGALIGFIAYCLAFGLLDSWTSGETTMQRQLPLWPSIGASFLLCVLLAGVAIVCGVIEMRRAAGGDRK
jgi:TRAP-type C4-dicarboxylate transport system permease small subunit